MRNSLHRPLVAALVALAVSVQSHAGTWSTEGPQTGPSANTILADTGPLAASGSRVFTVIVRSTLGTVVAVEYRNAANDGNVKSQEVAIPANETVHLKFEPGVDMNADDERIRVRLIPALTLGTIQASILH